MALLSADSFDFINLTQFYRKWNYIDGASAIGAYGRNGTNGIRVSGNFTDNALPIVMTGNTVIIALAGKFLNAVTAFEFLYIQDVNTSHAVIGFNVDGSIYVTCPAGTFTSAAAALPTPTAVHNSIQIKLVIDDAVGSIEVRVNNVTVINQTNKDTKATANAYATRIRLVSNGAGSNGIDVDDFLVLDGSGAAPLNTFPGDIRVEGRLANAAGSVMNLAPSAGSNEANVDDNPANDNTDYNASSTPGDKDLYGVQDLVSVAGSVLAVCVTTQDQKDDAGARTHSHLAKLGGVELEGTAYPATVGYSIHQTVFPTKPGGGAWSIADVNAAEFGFKLAS